MSSSVVRVLLLAGWGLGSASAREWSDIVSPLMLNPIDTAGFSYLIRNDPFFGDQVLTGESVQTSAPVAQTSFPTYSPTAVPTTSPTTDAPSTMPSLRPSESPTFNPTPAPDPYPEIPVPANPPRTYFNYNTTDSSRHGPGELGLVPSGDTFRVGIKGNSWGSVQNPSNFYWDEFTNNGWGPWKGVLQNRNVKRNVCESGSMQSPIDVRENGAACDEHHEVRSLPGDYKLTSSRVKKEIHPNKLRLLYERRPCADLDKVECQEPDPPYADFPNGWGGFADVLHIDFKVKGEHRIWTEEFDAEMQIFHIHPSRRRLPTQAVLIRARENGFNPYFQTALDAFQHVYELNRAQCALRFRRERRSLSEAHELFAGDGHISSIDYSSWDKFSTDMDRPDFEEHSAEMERLLQNRSWDPHHPLLIPTIHFYRYDGSLTEPPCGEFVSWFVADKPMIIDFRQLEQLQTIQFTHYDDKCRQTSVHHEHSVARPIRPIGRRPIWRCTPDDFGPDP